MADYSWDTLEDLYISLAELTFQKGAVIEILMTCSKPIGTLNGQILDSFFASWSFPHKGKYVNPFTILEFSSEDNLIKTKLLLKKKNKEVDELKLLFQDVLHFLNSDHIQVKSIEANVS